MKAFFHRGLILSAFIFPLFLNAQTSFCGCTNPEACNYDPNVNCDDGSCVIAPNVGDPDTLALCGDLTLAVPVGFDFYSWSTGSTELSIPVSELGYYSVSYGNEFVIPDTGAVPPALFKESLLAYYSFDGTTTDLSENSNNGIAMNTSYVSDRFGNENSAIQFTGASSSIVTIQDSGQLDFGLNRSEFSVSIWIK